MQGIYDTISKTLILQGNVVFNSAITAANTAWLQLPDYFPNGANIEFYGACVTTPNATPWTYTDASAKDLKYNTSRQLVFPNPGSGVQGLIFHGVMLQLRSDVATS